MAWNLRVLLFAKPVGPIVQSTFLLELLVFDWTGQCDSLRVPTDKWHGLLYDL
jgi:hypothetical protein